MSKRFQRGDFVERFIEGVWFPANIEVVNSKRNTLSLKYLDDDNIETDVPFSEVRESDCNNLPTLESKSEHVQCQSPISRDWLMKPLLGLIEDDSEQRSKLKPTVILHRDLESSEAIIINGAENQLAVGGGVRARRYLKK